LTTSEVPAVTARAPNLPYLTPLVDGRVPNRTRCWVRRCCELGAASGAPPRPGRSPPSWRRRERSARRCWRWSPRPQRREDPRQLGDCQCQESRRPRLGLSVGGGSIRTPSVAWHRVRQSTRLSTCAVSRARHPLWVPTAEKLLIPWGAQPVGRRRAR